ncbi:MAG TPA: DUF2939 domain-containing protein [Sphingomonadaceae bacterium]|nr:DUF2939 domain-containing protein [Sphingomonadaceae bacterium]
MRKLIVIGAVIVALLAGGWAFASPWIAMDSLRDAAREADREALEQNIDFPALRASLKEQMRAALSREASRRGENDPLKGSGALLANGFIDGVVDGVITPDGVGALLVTGSLVPMRDGNPAREIDWAVQRTGLSSFRAVPKGENERAFPALVFTRDGLSWKLAAIDIPEPELAKE